MSKREWKDRPAPAIAETPFGPVAVIYLNRGCMMFQSGTDGRGYITIRGKNYRLSQHFYKHSDGSWKCWREGQDGPLYYRSPDCLSLDKEIWKTWSDRHAAPSFKEKTHEMLSELAKDLESAHRDLLLQAELADLNNKILSAEEELEKAQRTVDELEAHVRALEGREQLLKDSNQLEMFTTEEKGK